MSYPQAQYGEYAGLRKKLKKVFKAPASLVQKVTRKGPLKAVKKVLRKSAAVTAGIATAGLVKPKFVGIKQKGSKKLFRYAGTATKIVGGVALGVMAAPFIGPAIGTAAKATLGGLKFVGGKLVAAPKAVMSLLSAKGINPKTATPEQAIQAGIETGDVTPSMIEQLGTMIPEVGSALLQAYQKPQVEYPGGVDYPASPEGVSPGGEGVRAGMLDTIKPYLPWIGVGVVAIILIPKLVGGKK